MFMNVLYTQANANDEGMGVGVLAGKWSDTYPEGTTNPCSWTGSVAILQQYMNTKRYVCYGQCWAFSGVVTTRKYRMIISLLLVK